jgi:chromosome segregation ATPase
VERDRAFLFERSKGFEEELNAERQEALKQRQEQTAAVQALQKNKVSLVEELAEQRRAAASQRSETARLLQDREAQIGNLQSYIKEKESRTQEALASLKMKNDLIDQLRSQLSSLESQDSVPKSGLLTREEGDAMQSQMRENLAHIKKLDAHISALKKENAHYKSLDLNLSKKDEQVSSLKAQLLTLAQLRTELAETQVENASLKQERAKWASFSGDADPVSMARNLATERFRVAELQELLGVEKAEKAGRESYIKRLEDNAHATENTLSTIKSQSEKLAAQFRVLERQRRLAERESTFLREQLVRSFYSSL